MYVYLPVKKFWARFFLAVQFYILIVVVFPPVSDVNPCAKSGDNTGQQEKLNFILNTDSYWTFFPDSENNLVFWQKLPQNFLSEVLFC